VQHFQSPAPTSLPLQYDWEYFNPFAPQEGPQANDVHHDTAALNNQHVCPECFKVYGRPGDLARHYREKHGPSIKKYLCPVEKCPKGIPGNGFDRMHGVVEHLKRGKHNMDDKEAVYLAHKHNVTAENRRDDRK
jgi:uncharacterized Zn-finger protein